MFHSMRLLKCFYLMLVAGVYACDVAGAVSTSRRAVCVPFFSSVILFGKKK